MKISHKIAAAIVDKLNLIQLLSNYTLNLNQMMREMNHKNNYWFKHLMVSFQIRKK